MFMENNDSDFVSKIYDKSLTGISGYETAYELADRYLRNNNGNTKKAIKNFISVQTTKSAVSGFVTNIGGILTLSITLPANIISIIYIQLRMIQKLPEKHLRQIANKISIQLVFVNYFVLYVYF